MKLKLSEIKIPEYLLNSTPDANKVRKKKNNYLRTGMIQSIIVDNTRTLLDGYITYKILTELRPKDYEVEVILKSNYCYKNQPTLYVYGVHPGDSTAHEYCWRVTKDLIDCLDLVGKKILCQTKFGIAPVIVSKTEVLDTPPVEGRIKKVVRIKGIY